MSKMTQEQVRAKLAKLRDKKAALDEKIEMVRVEIRFLQHRCKHPSIRHGRDIDGGSSSYCPDCEYCD